MSFNGSCPKSWNTFMTIFFYVLINLSTLLGFNIYITQLSGTQKIDLIALNIALLTNLYSTGSSKKLDFFNEQVVANWEPKNFCWKLLNHSVALEVPFYCFTFACSCIFNLSCQEQLWWFFRYLILSSSNGRQSYFERPYCGPLLRHVFHFLAFM